jgi:hypothetical protein
MEVNELELIPHFLLLRDLVCRLHDLRRKSCLLVFVFLDQRLLLTVLLLEELLDTLRLDVARTTVLATHQDLTLEVVGVLPDFSNGHVRLFENSP